MTDHAAHIDEQYRTGAAQAKASTSKQERMAKVIADLLASAEQAAKRGEEVEVQRLLDQASALQLKFAIADAMLARSGSDQAEPIEQARFCEEQNTPLIKAKRELINGLAQLYRGKAILCGAYRYNKDGSPVLRKGRHVYDKRAYVQVYAHTSDLAFISQMYTSLILQMQTFMAADEKEMRRDPMWVLGQRVAAWRVSYAYGYVRRVYVRLAEAKAAQERAADTGTPGTALVLRDRTALVEHHVTANVGALRKANHRIDDNDPAGKAAGRAAGDRADLGGKKVSGSGTRQLEK